MVSMKDIARQLNLSRCTVSNILNNHLENKSYRKETIELVRNTAQEMGYVSNNMARSLKTGSTGTIAIVVPDIANTFYIQIIKEVERQANHCGYSLIICMAEEILERENAALTMLQSRCVDGVLISPVSYQDSLSRQYPFKVVCFDRRVSDNRFPYVLIDNYQAGRALAECLIADGAKRPLFLAGSRFDYTVTERYRGFCDVLRSHGLIPQPEYFLTGLYDDKSAYDIMMEAISRELEFDAVFLCTNYFVYGVLQAVRSCGHELISIGGFECFSGMNLLAENIHIINQPEEEIGRKAFSKLCSLLKGEEVDSQILRYSVI